VKNGMTYENSTLMDLEVQDQIASLTKEKDHVISISITNYNYYYINILTKQSK